MIDAISVSGLTPSALRGTSEGGSPAVAIASDPSSATIVSISDAALQAFARLADSAAADGPQLTPLVPRRVTPDDLRDAMRTRTPILSPQEAFASGAELGPPSGTGRADNQASKIHTEIKVNGKVIARTYNSGAVEIAGEFAFLTDELLAGFAADKGTGPDLAEDRAKRIEAALVAHGAVTREQQGAGPAAVVGAPVVELLRASTAQSQQDWLAEKEKEGPLEPGALFSRTV